MKEKHKSKKLHFVKATKGGILGKKTNKHPRCCFPARAKFNIMLESKQKPLRHLGERLENHLWLNNSALFPLFFKSYVYKIKIMP